MLCTPSPAAADGCRKADTKPTHLSKQEARKAVRCLINNVRDNNGRRDLDPHRRLRRAAHRHTNYMEDHHCISHQCPGEPSLETRLRRADYIRGGHDRWGYSENIAQGVRRYGTPRRVVRMWMGSSAHRSTILSGSWDELGIGFVKGTLESRSGSGGFYTVDFGFTRG